MIARMSNQFKAGDIVQLKSGGPPLTVDLVWHDPEEDRYRVDCCWFTPDQEYNDATFGPEALKPYVG